MAAQPAPGAVVAQQPAMTQLPSMRNASVSVFSFGNCRLELLTRGLWRSGEPVSIRRTVFDLIVYLLRVRPRVATRDELAEHVWQRANVSSVMIAKAVMEARRAIGDDGGEPSLIVSIHGMGYRFAAAVTEGMEHDAPPTDDDVVACVREAVVRADQASARGDYALAQLEAEHALMKAESSGINRARIDAMLACARVATFSGTVERMLRLTAAALKLAQAERLPDLVCEAQVELAHVHLLHGSALQAIELLQAAMQVLQHEAPSILLLRCEARLHLAHGDLHQFAQGRSWCRRSQVTAERLGDLPRLRKQQLNEVALLLKEGMLLADQGRGPQAQATFAEALEIVTAIDPEPGEQDLPETRVLWLSNRSFALMMNDRLEEAWVDAKALQHALEHSPHPDGPYNAQWRAIFHGQIGLLLTRSHRFTEAFEKIEAGLQMATALQSLPTLVLLHSYAVVISRTAGLYERAFEHLRLQRDAERELHTQQANTFMTLLRVESETESIAQELEAARARVRQLEATCAALDKRLSQLEGVGIVDTLGFGAPSMVEGMMTTAHALAQDRDLPYCLLMLVVDNYADLAKRSTQAVLDGMAMTIGRQLLAADSIRQPVVRWRASHFLIVTDNLGLKRARAMSDALLETLRRVNWPAETLAGMEPRFVCRCADAAQYPTLADAVQAIE